MLLEAFNRSEIKEGNAFAFKIMSKPVIMNELRKMIDPKTYCSDDEIQTLTTSEQELKMITNPLLRRSIGKLAYMFLKS